MDVYPSVMGLSALQLLAGKTFAEKVLGLGWSDARVRASFAHLIVRACA